MAILLARQFVNSSLPGIKPDSMTAFKPEGYNSLSPYLIADDAAKLVEQLREIFDADVLRRFDAGNGRIAHVELRLDDSVIMISDSTPAYPATCSMLHMYVPDVFRTYSRALELGCAPIEAPANNGEDPDTRGSFHDLAGNHWSVSSQTHTA